MPPMLVLSLAVAMTAIGQLLLKEGMNRHGHLRVRSGPATLLRVVGNPWGASGFGLVFGASILWLAVLSHLELSFAYPMLSLSYIVVLAASALVLKERVTTRQVCGVLIITLGVALVSMTG